MILVKESILFQKKRDPKSALGLNIKQDLLDFRIKKITERDFSWSGLDINFKNINDWIWEVDDDPFLSEETKNLWLNWLKELKKQKEANDIKREK